MLLFTSRRRPVVKAVIARAGAAFLILVTPFTVFLQYHGYGYANSAVLLCLFALALFALALGVAAALSPLLEVLVLAGLLALFADFQFHPPKGIIGLAIIGLGLAGALWVVRQHAVRIVTVTMATMLLATLLLPSRSVAAGTDLPAAVRRHGDGPLLVHVILDEHVGVEAFRGVSSLEFRSRLRSFFVERGFLLFGRAYSEYFNTYRSLGALLNFKPGDFLETLVVPGRTELPWDLTRNAYFAQLTSEGYGIHVYQPDYLNYCADPGPATSCHTYAATSLGALAPISLPPAQKARVITSMYLDRSNTYAFLRQMYNSSRTWLATRRIRVPPWTWDRNRLSPVSSMVVLRKITDDLSRAQRGEAVFAHLLLPHFPYVYNRDCIVRPPAEWLDRTDHGDVPSGVVNSERGRELRYALYREQVECLYSQLDRLIQAVPATLQRDAIIIIQGDHGSRIVRKQPTGQTQPSPADLIDGFSTLFAVKSPWLRAGYDRRMASITCILSVLGRTDFHSVDGLQACTGIPSVFVYEETLPHAADGGRDVVARPFPPFGEAVEGGSTAGNGSFEQAQATTH